MVLGLAKHIVCNLMPHNIVRSFFNHIKIHNFDYLNTVTLLRTFCMVNSIEKEEKMFKLKLKLKSIPKVAMKFAPKAESSLCV